MDDDVMRRADVKDKNGEHPLGDAGQLVLLGVFLAVWVGGSLQVS